ncbi:Virginiamycin B lyase [compost metagenome]
MSADVTLTTVPVLPRVDVPLHLEDKVFETTARAYVGFEEGRGASTQVRLTLLKKVGSDPEAAVGQPLVLDASTFPRAIDLGRLGPNATYALSAEALDATATVLIAERVEWGVGNDRNLASKNLMMGFEPTVSTLSGSTIGFADGIVEDEPLTQARYNMPSGMTLGADGAVYLSDYENRRIRRLDLVADKVSTWATLSHKPIMLTKSPDGSLYATSTDWISNASVSRLYRITAKDTHGYYPGVGPGEQIVYLSGVCLDPQGNLYVSASNAIWRYSTSLQLWEKVATFAAGTNFTSLVATQNALYATVYASSRIYRISLEGQASVETFAGGDTQAVKDGAVATAQLHSPRSLALSGDTLYFSDNGRIRRIKGGMVKTIAGGLPGASFVPPVNGKGSEATFSEYIDGLLVMPDGDLLVADSFNHQIRKLTFVKSSAN